MNLAVYSRRSISPLRLAWRGYSLWPFVIRRLPGLVWVVKLHVLYDVEGIGAQVLLIYDSPVTHYETLHPRHTVFGRHGDEGKPADHDSLDDIVNLAQRRGRTLTFQNLKVIPV